MTITAPIDGTIVDREIPIGQSVADAGAKLMTITDARQVLVTANIYERDSGRIKIGQQVSVKVPGAGDRVFSGQVTTSIVDFVEPETEVRDLPTAEILVLEEAADDRVHLESKSGSVRIDSLSETLRER